MSQVFDTLIGQGLDEVLHTANGETLSLSSLKAQLPKVRLIAHQAVFLTHNNGRERCFDLLNYQWLTAQDNPGEGRPVVAYPNGNSLSESSPETWRVLFHETISALGVVDDEYQISGPLLLQLAKGPKGNPAGIPFVETRSHAPRFALDKSDRCYSDSPLQVARGSRGDGGDGNATGIGGGGNGRSLTFKELLLGRAEAWWRKSNARHYGDAEFRKFQSFLTGLGIEPMDLEAEGLVVVLQAEIKKSKRTGRLTAFVPLNSIFAVSETSRAFLVEGALNLVWRHVYYQMLPAKTDSARERRTVYGGELAKARGCRVAEGEEMENTNPCFPPEGRR